MQEENRADGRYVVVNGILRGRIGEEKMTIGRFPWTRRFTELL